MRVMISGGGTGGHVYPALSVAQALRRGGDEVIWLGRPGSLEEALVTREALPFRAVSSGALRGGSPLLLPAQLARLAQGMREALRVIDDSRPAALLATGGYVSAPPVLAARRRRLPVLVYLPDMEPGLAVRFLARLAQRVAVSFDEVARQFPGRRLRVTGYPVRPGLWRGDQTAARRRLGLPSEGKVLLVMGGSQGARSINRGLASGLERVLALASIVHLTGKLDVEEMRARREMLPEDLRHRYHVYDYLHQQMTDAMVAADLAVARAGAATLGEFPNAGLPSLLVPYPFAGHHQLANARFLERHGAAAVLMDQAVRQGELPQAIEGLLHDGARLAGMAEAARRLAVPDAAERLVRALHELAGDGRQA